MIAGLTAPEDRITAYARDVILAKDYLRALRLRGIVAREIDGVLSRFDAIVGPSRATAGPRLGAEFRSAIRGSFPDVLGALGAAAGLPAVGGACGRRRQAGGVAVEGTRGPGQHAPRGRARGRGRPAIPPGAPAAGVRFAQ